MEIVISRFSSLIHPDWSRVARPYRPLDPRQIEVRQAWEDRTVLLAQDPNAFLWYFSSLWADRLEAGLQGRAYHLNPVEVEDIDRIKRFRQLLGWQRIAVYGYSGIDKLPTRRELIRDLNERQIRYDPRESEMIAYGEIWEWCVQIVGERTRKNLGIPISSYNAQTSGISICATDAVIFEHWQEKVS